jgi:hypothetical protein
VTNRPNLHLIQGDKFEPGTDSLLEVTIFARGRREPYGRAGPYQLTERGLKELAAAAARMERACR